MIGPHLPKARLFDIPTQLRAHKTVRFCAVDWELLAVRVGKSVEFGPLQNEIGCELKRWRRGHAMQSSQVTKILVGSSPVCLVSERSPLLRIEKRLLSETRDRTNQGDRNNDAANQAKSVHRVIEDSIWNLMAPILRRCRMFASLRQLRACRWIDDDT